MNYDLEHQKTLEETGFWGKAGAGCIIKSINTQRILLPLRSRLVEQPLTWGTFGGAIDPNEDVKSALLREVKEEIGFVEVIKLIPLVIFKKDSFIYHNYLMLVDMEFEPKLNWETEKTNWFYINYFPKPLHFGLEYLMNDYNSRMLILNS